jgi:hypothetical protein
MEKFKQTFNKIKSKGYYYIEFSPKDFQEDRLKDLKEAKKQMQDSKVTLRGWPFPLIPMSNKEFSEMYNANNCIETWIDVPHFLEVWRYYKSGLFVDYNAFHEDWYKESEFVENSSYAKINELEILDVIGVIYRVTEMIIFTANLAQEMADVPEFYLKFVLNNVKDRKLKVLDSKRAGLSMDYVCRVKDITYENYFTREEITGDYRKISKKIITNIFENFNWEGYSEALIDDEQEKLITRSI